MWELNDYPVAPKLVLTGGRTYLLLPRLCRKVSDLYMEDTSTRVFCRLIPLQVFENYS